MIKQGKETPQRQEGSKNTVPAIDKIRFVFLYAELYSMGATWVYPESRIPYNILRYIVKGKAEFCINGEKVLVQEDQIVYIPNGCRMSCHALTETFEFYSVRFATSVLYESEDVLRKYYGIKRITDNSGEDAYFKEIHKWVKSDHIARKCFVRGCLEMLIGTLSLKGEQVEIDESGLENEERDPNKQKSGEWKIGRQMDSRVQVVADYIILHPVEKYTPEKMANMVSLSKQRFSSLFKDYMGKTPMEYVREIRLTTAARTLLLSDKNINDIAYDVGYEDTNYFIREFKAAFGFTPNQYRKVAKEG